MVIVATWMFGLYAALSYVVPNKLCSSAVRDSAVRMPVLHMPAAAQHRDPHTCMSSPLAIPQGVAQGFGNCVYNHDGEYSQHSLVAIFWLVFWALQQFWISGFSALMGYAMFPQCFRTIDICIIVTLAMGSALVTLVGAPLGHYPLNANLLVYLPGEAECHLFDSKDDSKKQWCSLRHSSLCQRSFGHCRGDNHLCLRLCTLHRQ